MTTTRDRRSAATICARLAEEGLEPEWLEGAIVLLRKRAKLGWDAPRLSSDHARALLAVLATEGDEDK